MQYRGYSIEQERNGTFSAYRIGASMHDCHTGFATAEVAKSFINNREGR